MNGGGGGTGRERVVERNPVGGAAETDDGDGDDENCLDMYFKGMDQFWWKERIKLIIIVKGNEYPHSNS